MEEAVKETVEEGAEADDEDEEPPKKKRSRKRKAAVEQTEGAEGDDEHEEPKKPKRQNDNKLSVPSVVRCWQNAGKTWWVTTSHATYQYQMMWGMST